MIIIVKNDRNLSCNTVNTSKISSLTADHTNKNEHMRLHIRLSDYRFLLRSCRMWGLHFIGVLTD